MTKHSSPEPDVTALDRRIRETIDRLESEYFEPEDTWVESCADPAFAAAVGADCRAMLSLLKEVRDRVENKIETPHYASGANEAEDWPSTGWRGADVPLGMFAAGYEAAQNALGSSGGMDVAGTGRVRADENRKQEIDVTALDLIAKWRERAEEKRGTFHLHSERSIAAIRRCADELEAALAASRERPTPEQVQLLAWCATNCHMLARRALARSTSSFDREKWEHVLRICEKAGARSSGVLRASLPTEMTEGEAVPPVPVAGLDLVERIEQAARDVSEAIGEWADRAARLRSENAELRARLAATTEGKE